MDERKKNKKRDDWEMTHKPDEQKIKSFLKRLNDMHIDISKGTSLTKIAEICKDIFTIESEETIDEAFGVNINKSVYYDTECEGQVMDGDSDIDETAISYHYDDYIEMIDDESATDLTEEQKQAIRCAINRAKAEVIIQMNRALNDYFTETFEKNVEEICKEFNITYDEWQEYSMIFIIDGKRWDWDIWGNYITYNDEEECECEEVSLDETESTD